MMTIAGKVWRGLAGVTLALAIALPGAALALSPAAPLPNFPTASQAQQHCPGDTVVWLNPSGIYHFKGERWYGATKRGTYVCRREADAAGMRATRNGQ